MKALLTRPTSNSCTLWYLPYGSGYIAVAILKVILGGMGKRISQLSQVVDVPASVHFAIALHGRSSGTARWTILFKKIVV